MLDSIFFETAFYVFVLNCGTVIDNLYIQTSFMVALSLFRGKEGGAVLINQRWTLAIEIVPFLVDLPIQNGDFQ